jgi:hypothetical protein
MKTLLMLFHPGDLIGDWSLVWILFFLVIGVLLIALFIAFFIYTVVWLAMRFDKERKKSSLKIDPFCDK